MLFHFNFLTGDRGCHGNQGPIEKASEALIVAAGKGDFDAVNSLIMAGAVDVNVADKNGHTALLGAAVSCYLVHRSITGSTVFYETITLREL